MRHLLKSLALLLLLIAAQQGAVIHEMAHVTRSMGPELALVAGAADTSCALCPAYAQVVSPAMSHAFHIPDLVRDAPIFRAEPTSAAIDDAVLEPRSRGPPSASG